MQFTNEAMSGGAEGSIRSEHETRATDGLAERTVSGCPLFQYCTHKFYNISLPEIFFDLGHIRYKLHYNA